MAKLKEKLVDVNREKDIIQKKYRACFENIQQIKSNYDKIHEQKVATEAELKVAKEHVEEMAVDVQGKIKDVTDQLKNDLNILLGEEKFSHEKTKANLKAAKEALCKEKQTRSENERAHSKEQENLTALIERLARSNRACEKERQEYLNANEELTKQVH